MLLEITSDPKKRIEQARAIVHEKNSIYTDRMLDYIRNVVRKKTSLQDETAVEDEMYTTIYFYWAYGCPVDEYYYLHFSDKSHEERKQYMTTREKVIYRNHLNSLSDAHLLNNKWETYCFFREYYGRDVIQVKSEADWQVFCSFLEKHHDFVVKPVNLGGGFGVHKVETPAKISEQEKHRLFEGLLSECKANQTQYLKSYEPALVLEELLEQVPEMAVFHPQSINAVRATTIRIGNDVHLYHPWFKFGRGGNFLTSALFGTLDAVIDEKTGIIITQGCSEKNERFDAHPDTGVQILGFHIPKWEELKRTVTELAMKLDTIRYVGWDMVLTKKGWVLMEGNFSGDFCWQFCENRGTKQEFEELIGWKLTKEFWWQE